MKTVNFKDLAGEIGSLYLNTDLNRFQLGSCIFQVIEDESDGYRSYMQDVLLVSDSIEVIGVPLAQVEIINGGESSFDGFLLVDKKDNHIWLKFGTDNYDEYYPSFIFQWNPKYPEKYIELKEENNIEQLKTKIK